MYIRGDGCGLSWDRGMAMTAKGNNEFEAEVSCSGKEDSLEVKVLLNDDTWMVGSNHHVDVSSSVDEVYPWFFSKKGEYFVVDNVYSSELENSRSVLFYTPPSYNENYLKQHKNLIVMHDGQNLCNPRTSAFGVAWNIQDTIDELVVEGKMDEVVVVGPYSTSNRTAEYTYSYDPEVEDGGKGDLYLDFLESTVIPLAEKTVRVDVTRDRLGIIGSSLGGLISCYAGWTRPSVYGKPGCMSSSFWWNSMDFKSDVIPTYGLPPSPIPLIYMDSGTQIGGEAQIAVDTVIIKGDMEALGYVEGETLIYYLDEGASHSEASWGARFNHPMEALYPPTTV